jgi:hypothetical protein
MTKAIIAMVVLLTRLALVPSYVDVEQPTLSGVATVYGDPVHFGRPLYCDRGNGLSYRTDMVPWIAVDVSEYESGRVRCGDLMLVVFDNGALLAQAYDAGYLYKHYVEQWLPRRIVADVPVHLAPHNNLSALVEVWNISALARQQEGTDGQAKVQGTD